MNSRAIHDAFEARFNAGFTRCGAIRMNSVGEPPADGSPFVVLQFPLGREEHVGLGQVGQRTFREEGVARFVLHMPRGSGTADALDWTDEIRALFRAVQFDGVSTLSPSPPVLNDDADLGTYFVVSTAVEFYFDHLA